MRCSPGSPFTTHGTIRPRGWLEPLLGMALSLQHHPVAELRARISIMEHHLEAQGSALPDVQLGVAVFLEKNVVGLIDVHGLSEGGIEQNPGAAVHQPTETVV